MSTESSPASVSVQRNVFKHSPTFQRSASHRRSIEHSHSSLWYNVQKGQFAEDELQRREMRVRRERQLCTADGLSTSDRVFVALSLLEQGRRYQYETNRELHEARRKDSDFTLIDPTVYATVRKDVRVIMAKPVPKSHKKRGVLKSASPDIDGDNQSASQDSPRDHFAHTMDQLSRLKLWT